MKEKKLIGLLMFICFSLIIVGCGNSSEGTSAHNNGKSESANKGETHTFKVAHIAAESHIWTDSMKKFNEELQERSNNRLSVEIFPGASLGNEPDMMTQMAAGSLDMGIVTTAELTNRSDAFNAWFMPFLLEDSLHATEMFSTQEAKDIMHSLSEEEGVHGLGYLFVESRDVLMKDAHINDLATDLDGKKIRVTPSPVTIDFWESLGASPVPIPLPELYSAFQTGVVDAVESGPVGVDIGNYLEVGKKYSKTNHMMFTSVGLFSQQVWDSLSEEDKGIIEEAFAAAQEYNAKLSLEEENENLGEFEEQGAEIETVERTPELNEIIDQFYKEYSNNDYVKAFIQKVEDIKE